MIGIRRTGDLARFSEGFREVPSNKPANRTNTTVYIRAQVSTAFRFFQLRDAYVLLRMAETPIQYRAPMKHLTLTLVALLLIGCNAMEESPVAPSAVIPAGPPSGPGLPMFTAFDVTLHNGTTYAIADSPWLGILSVLPHEGALVTTPSRVTADCGNGTVITLPAGIGSDIRFSCRWATSGDVVVRAVVEAQNGVTTSAQLPLHVEPPIVVTHIVTVDIAAAPGAVVDHQQAWTFTPATTGPAVSLTWDFGDSSTTLINGPNAATTHHYRQNGIYVVTATATLQDGSRQRAGRTEIVVTAL